MFTTNSHSHTKVAILDLYNGHANMGMKNIQNILLENGFTFEVFDVRAANQLPDGSHDIYISTGGPGSPFDGEGQEWEENYFQLIDSLYQHNLTHTRKKFVFFICHSFQMMVRHFGFGEVCKRRSMSFGVFPVHKTEEGEQDLLFHKLPSPFYVADFRHYQVIKPNYERLAELGGYVVALEKVRPHVEYERAVMAIRITPEFIGTQFHPEADPEGMKDYYEHPEKRLEIIKAHGEYKYDEIMDYLVDTDADSLLSTFNIILPTFLRQAHMNLATYDLEFVL